MYEHGDESARVDAQEPGSDVLLREEVDTVRFLGNAFQSKELSYFLGRQRNARSVKGECLSAEGPPVSRCPRPAASLWYRCIVRESKE